MEARKKVVINLIRFIAAKRRLRQNKGFVNIVGNIANLVGLLEATSAAPNTPFLISLPIMIKKKMSKVAVRVLFHLRMSRRCPKVGK